MISNFQFSNIFKIFAKVNGNITFWPGEHFVAKGEYLTKFRAIMEEVNATHADGHVMFVSDKYLKQLGIRDFTETPNIAGIAPLSAVCKEQYKMKSIVERDGLGTYAIKVFLHEVGHNLGMAHESAWKKKLGNQYNCHVGDDYKNIMRTYDFDNWVIKKPYKWTACNRCDLLNCYQKLMDKTGEYCLDKTYMANK